MTTRHPDPVLEARRQWIEHGWLEASDGVAVILSVARVQQLMVQRIDYVLRPLELSFARYELLMLLAFSSSGAIPMSKLGTYLQVRPASVTSTVNLLQSQGLVRRESSPDDGRVVLASLTPAGRAKAKIATREMNARIFERRVVSDTDTQSLIRILGEIRTVVGNLIDPR